MYIVLALLSAVFSSLTAIFGKKGLRETNSHVATFVRTGMVLLYVWGFAFFLGVQTKITDISPRSLLFLLLSGCATGVSWLCYYKALSIGEVSRVTAIDKSSILITMLIGMSLLGERVTAAKVMGLLVIAAGTYLMIGKVKEGKGKRCLFYASISAVFAALTSILAKVGLGEVDANLGTAIRTGVVFIFSGIMLFPTGAIKELTKIKKRDILFLLFSALTTSLAWLFYFNALRMGEASVIAPLDKLSTVITILFSVLFLKEKISRKMIIGAVIMTLGTILTLF